MDTTRQETDQALVTRVQRGDRRAFDILVLKYQGRILALIARYIRDQHEVKDVAQEAFVKAYKALPTFRGESAFYTWLYRIAINTAKNHLVAQGRRPPQADIDIQDAVQLTGAGALKELQSPEQALLQEQLQKAIHRAISALPEDLRAAFTLREFEGLSYEDISAIMGCPVGTVRSRIFRARAAVDQVIAPYISTGRREKAPQAGVLSEDVRDNE